MSTDSKNPAPLVRLDFIPLEDGNTLVVNTVRPGFWEHEVRNPEGETVSKAVVYWDRGVMKVIPDHGTAVWGMNAVGGPEDCFAVLTR